MGEKEKGRKREWFSWVYWKNFRKSKRKEDWDKVNKYYGIRKENKNKWGVTVITTHAVAWEVKSIRNVESSPAGGTIKLKGL